MFELKIKDLRTLKEYGFRERYDSQTGQLICYVYKKGKTGKIKIDTQTRKISIDNAYIQKNKHLDIFLKLIELYKNGIIEINYKEELNKV